MAAAQAFTRTLLHYFPNFNSRLALLPDTRDRTRIVYMTEFMVWWGLMLFACHLGSRRQLNFQLRDMSTCVLQNMNALAGTRQETLPDSKTLPHFLGHVGSKPIGVLRTELVKDLIRNRVLDAYRLHGRVVVGVDATGFLVFDRCHCEHCIRMKHASGTLWMHPVLEAKVLGGPLALSVATEFIENPEAITWDDWERVKQDCELKAFYRLAPQLAAAFRRTPLCIAGDGLYACGPVIQLCTENRWAYVLTLKQDRLPSVWREAEALIKLNPENTRTITLPDGTIRVYHWVNHIEYEDSEKRIHRLNVIICKETVGDKTTTFAWITNLPVDKTTVDDIATNGGRIRWNIENQGFNTQKNGGYNLQHAYSHNEEIFKAYYYLLQIAHNLLQLVQHGSLLAAAAGEHGKKTVKAFLGSLANLPRRLLECLRFRIIPAEALDPLLAAGIRIRLDTS